jgi:hypothetical protein
MSIESLLKYPCGDSLMLLANISSLSSDFGSRPVHNRSSGLLGKGALIVPLPAFLPSRMNHVFRKLGARSSFFDPYKKYMCQCSFMQWPIPGYSPKKLA